jgi:hypothetical protein
VQEDFKHLSRKFAHEIRSKLASQGLGWRGEATVCVIKDTIDDLLVYQSKLTKLKAIIVQMVCPLSDTFNHGSKEGA